MSTHSYMIDTQDGFTSNPTVAGLVHPRIWNEAVEKPIQDFLSYPGKRIRADLINIAFSVGGGEGPAPTQVIDFVELLHAGSLVVDDIQDNSLRRRDQEALHVRYGVPIALNAGNWMYFAAFKLLADTEFEQNNTVRVIRHSLDIVKRCHEGQALDLSTRFDLLPSSELYTTAKAISQLKTGSLTGLATWLGGISASADDEICNQLSIFGSNLGIALQMQNDLAELKKAAQGSGKSDDLRNHRVTWPWAWLAANYSQRQVQATVELAKHQSLDLVYVASELLEKIEDIAVNEIGQVLEYSLSRLPSLGPTESMKLDKILASLELQYV